MDEFDAALKSIPNQLACFETEWLDAGGREGFSVLMMQRE